MQRRQSVRTRGRAKVDLRRSRGPSRSRSVRIRAKRFSEVNGSTQRENFVRWWFIVVVSGGDGFRNGAGRRAAERVSSMGLLPR